MKMLLNIPDADSLAKIARAATNKDIAFLFDKIRSANNEINKLLRTTKDDIDFRQLQGAGQIVDEIVELLDKSYEWLESLKKKEI